MDARIKSGHDDERVTSMTSTILPAVIAALLLFISPTPAPAAAPSDGAKAKPELSPEELAEKDARKACKQKICDIVATRDPLGEDVSCDIVKTWREEDIVKMLGGKISWPWGKAVCQSRLEVKRKDLALAMGEPDYDMVMPAQKLRCTLAQKDGGEPYAIEVTLAPTAKFENGRAKMNSSTPKPRSPRASRSAPRLMRGPLCCATKSRSSSEVRLLFGFAAR